MNFFLNRLFEDPFLISFADFFSYLKKKKNSGRFCKGLSLHRRKERIHPTSSLRSQARALSMSRFPPPASLQGRVGLSGSLKTLRRASKVEVLQEKSRSLVRRTSISLPVFFHTNVSASSSRVLAAASSSEACGGSEGSEGARPLSYLLHLHPPFHGDLSIPNPLWHMSEMLSARGWTWWATMTSAYHPDTRRGAVYHFSGGLLLAGGFRDDSTLPLKVEALQGVLLRCVAFERWIQRVEQTENTSVGLRLFFASDAAALSNPPRGFCPRRLATFPLSFFTSQMIWTQNSNQKLFLESKWIGSEIKSQNKRHSS